jgi:hypothetical protein
LIEDKEEDEDQRQNSFDEQSVGSAFRTSNNYTGNFRRMVFTNKNGYSKDLQITASPSIVEQNDDSSSLR